MSETTTETTTETTVGNKVIIASAARKGSKRAKAEAIYNSMTLTKKGKVRAKAPKPAAVKSAFVEKVGMTAAQAATYYHMIHSGKWAR